MQLEKAKTLASFAVGLLCGTALTFWWHSLPFSLLDLSLWVGFLLPLIVPVILALAVEWPKQEDRQITTDADQPDVEPEEKK